MPYTPEQLVDRLEGAITSMGEAEREFDEWIAGFVEAEAEYRLDRAKAWGRVEGTVADRERATDELTSESMKKAHTAEWMVKSGLEKVRNRRAILTAIQTATNAVKEEASIGRFGSDNAF